MGRAKNGIAWLWLDPWKVHIMGISMFKATAKSLLRRRLLSEPGTRCGHHAPWSSTAGSLRALLPEAAWGQPFI